MLTNALVIIGLNASIYMLIALGFTLIFGVLRIVNFAHGEFLMLGAYGLYVFNVLLGWEFWIALPLAALLTGVSGVLFERVLFRRFSGDELGGMIVSLGLAIFLQGLVRAVFGADSLAVPPPVSRILSVGGASLPLDQLIVAGVSLTLIAATFLLLGHTRLGLALRAVAQDPQIARVQGIVPRRMYGMAFLLACTLAGFAGALVAPLYGLQTYMGDQALMRAFIVVVLGGLGSIPGVVLASLVLASVDTAVAIMAGATAATLAMFVAVIGILVIRPQGLLGRP